MARSRSSPDYAWAINGPATPTKGLDPWRDTGIAIAGPAVADVEAAFAEAWAHSGPALPPEKRVMPAYGPPAGDVSLRVIPSMPAAGGMFRLDQLVASLATRTLWVTDAYFVGVSAYVETLTGAARDGVDVRLLVPGSGSDIAAVQRLTRAGYRSLLEGGVRVFEWNGSMMSAKTATEIVLSDRRVRPTHPGPRPRTRSRGGRTTRAAAGALRIGNTFGAALTAKRPIGRSEAFTLLYGAGMALAISTVAFLWPRWLSVPVGVIIGWLGLAWAARAVKLRRDGHHGDDGA